ncbi:FAD/NAD(P)-binding domain-containing protein [Rhodofomes roseus]|uniref:FAD/NAD(P)-binding domain-containing protein n=1 Tax=Rhodofomes roseus TaxID=34475 RepID=A0ABQ8KPA6_9APHY|nr:FAD/NAD(P)-binding domain-containing protein [Rhodofomes roseus]KAH9840023.1 FAD/NAD(P)-binding domain-containing protein [Rhodofomes roseus]
MSSNTGALLDVDFLVVGGGLAGLTVAFVLAESGHRVRVIEKRGLGVPAGGIRVPPNVSKLLAQWVPREELLRIGTLCAGTPLRHLEDGEHVGFLHWKADIMRELGGDFLLMHHEDLHRLLYTLATSAGVRVDFNTEVVAVHQGTEQVPNPSVSLLNGEVVTADFLIGADGPRSIVRKAVLGREDNAEPSFLTVYTTTIPGEKMREDPEMRRWLDSDDWPIWMGNNRSICAHPVRGHKDFGLHIYSWEGDVDPLAGEETWEDLVPVDTLDYSTHAPIVQKLLSFAPHLIRTRLMRRPEYEDDSSDEGSRWSDHTSRIVLIGESAHPWQPGGTHPVSIALEDAALFGTLFSRLTSWSQLPSFLAAYQELREERCAVVKASDIKNARMVAMPLGPGRDARDVDMRKSSADEWDEGTTKENFEEMAWVFGYVATDEADEWWVNWGRYSQEARGGEKHTSFSWQMVSMMSEPATTVTHDLPY